MQNIIIGYLPVGGGGWDLYDLKSWKLATIRYCKMVIGEEVYRMHWEPLLGFLRVLRGGVSNVPRS